METDLDIDVVARNIRALRRDKRRAEEKRTWSQRVADAITGFLGSMKSVALHATLFGGWIIVNLGVVPGVKPFDPFPFVMLAMFASVEAIFLTTFVLISQNRMIELQDRRAELDLEVDLLAEHEITHLVRQVDAIAAHLGVPERGGPHVEEMKKEVQPEQILKALEDAEREPH